MPDNPFYDPNNPIKSRIWALGLRNPFRMEVRTSATGALEVLLGDVGWATCAHSSTLMLSKVHITSQTRKSTSSTPVTTLAGLAGRACYHRPTTALRALTYVSIRWLVRTLSLTGHPGSFSHPAAKAYCASL